MFIHTFEKKEDYTCIYSREKNVISFLRWFHAKYGLSVQVQNLLTNNNMCHLIVCTQKFSYLVVKTAKK